MRKSITSSRGAVLMCVSFAMAFIPLGFGLGLLQNPSVPKELKAEQFTLVHDGVARARLYFDDRGRDNQGPSIALLSKTGVEVAALRLFGPEDKPELVFWEKSGVNMQLLLGCFGEDQVPSMAVFRSDGKQVFPTPVK